MEGVTIQPRNFDKFHQASVPLIKHCGEERVTYHFHTFLFWSYDKIRPVVPKLSCKYTSYCHIFQHICMSLECWKGVQAFIRLNCSFITFPSILTIFKTWPHLSDNKEHSSYIIYPCIALDVGFMSHIASGVEAL